MEHFACHGWLYITVTPNSEDILVKIKHEEHHHAYLDMIHLRRNGIRDGLKDAHSWSTIIPNQTLVYDLSPVEKET